MPMLKAPPASPRAIDEARRRFLKVAGGLAVGGVVVSAGGWALLRHGRNLFEVRRERTLMKTSVSINVLADDVEAARHAIAAAFDHMEAAAATLTRFDPASPVARLNRAGRLDNPPAMLRTVLEHAEAVSARTDGDFDVTVTPVLDYYLGLERPVRLSAADRRAVAKRERLVGYRDLVLDDAGVRLKRPGMAITLDGIAKGHVVDQGIAALRAAGIEYALIDAGGEIRAIAGSDPGRHWNVGIVDPLHTNRIAHVVRLGNAALSTSGNYEIFFTADRRLFHIIDPHTGTSPDRWSSVTVMADESMASDAMSVAAFSMDLARLKHAMATDNLQWLVTSWDGAAHWRSPDLPLITGPARIA